MKITPVPYRTLCKVFEQEGWIHARTRGDHLIYTKKGYLRPVVIPAYKSIPAFIILNNLRTAKISRERYEEIMSLL